MRKPAVMLLLLAALSACSVKEDRSDCPCTLLVDLSALSMPGGRPRTHKESLTLSIYAPDLVLRRSYELTEQLSAIPVETHRSLLTLSAALGSGSFAFRDGALKINCGEQSDSLYAFCSTIGAYSDTVTVKLRLCKQFSTVSIDIADAADYSFRIIGNVDGLSLATLEPTEGEFCYDMPKSGNQETHIFRMPRQSDKSISLQVWDNAFAELLYEVPLGGYLDAAGYDWDADNLQDVQLSLDPLGKSVTVTVLPWEEGRTFEFQ